jgi:hypothetical protein
MLVLISATEAVKEVGGRIAYGSSDSILANQRGGVSLRDRRLHSGVRASAIHLTSF